MKTLCFYISDYGYGHASRAIALIREIVDTCQDVRVIARTSGPFEFTRRSLIHPRVSVIDCRNDAGVTLKDGSLVVDRERTRESFLNWMQSWDDYISRECAFCRDNRVDLVLSDIAPQPFCVADILGIPSMAVSNFSWDTIFGHLFPDCSEVGILRDAYRQASHACILPFEIGMDGFPGRERVGLISRKISVPGPEMRKRCGIPVEDFLVYVG